MRVRTLLGVGVLCVAASSLAGAAGRRSHDQALHDLYFGEALYYARQGHFFDALERLDAELGQHRALDEPELDSLYYHRNDAAYRLARIHFQKGQLEDALAALERIQGKVPEGIRDDVEFLRANVFLGLGRNDDAVKVLRRLQGAASLKGFAGYNLGIALLDGGHEQEAFEQLDRAGQVSGGGEPVLAIRDKSNLVLGRLLVDSGRPDAAKRFFDRVRLDGPFSNAALLASGWAAASANDYERAVVPWGILAARESTDGAVQEAKLAVPFAYGKLEVYGRAAVNYASALDSFGAELKKVDASIASIREGKFLKALAREEIKQN